MRETVTGSTSRNDVRFYSCIGTDYIQEGIFERFPEFIPAVGKHFYREDGKHKKLLIVGESNYFPIELVSESDFQNAGQWYQGENAKLIPNYKKKDVSNWKGYKTFNKVGYLIDDSLKDNGIEVDVDENFAFHEAAFYNYFLRPAPDTGKGKRKKITPQAIDFTIAGVALYEIIQRLQVEIVVFVSTTAHNAFTDHLQKNNCHIVESCNIHKVSHPSSIWWNRNNGVYGKNKFREILEQYYISH